MAAPLSHCGQGLSCLGSVASPMPWGPAQAEGHGCHFPFGWFNQEQMPARISGAHRGHQYSWSHRLPQTGAAFNSTYIQDSQYTSTNCKLPFSSWQKQKVSNASTHLTPFRYTSTHVSQFSPSPKTTCCSLIPPPAGWGGELENKTQNSVWWDRNSLIELQKNGKISPNK